MTISLTKNLRKEFKTHLKSNRFYRVSQAHKSPMPPESSKLTLRQILKPKLLLISSNSLKFRAIESRGTLNEVRRLHPKE